MGALVRSQIRQPQPAALRPCAGGPEIGTDIVPSAHYVKHGEQGSIIVILATDAPLLPIQCQRLARRATTGLAWVGGFGSNGSGDIFLAFRPAIRCR